MNAKQSFSCVICFRVCKVVNYEIGRVFEEECIKEMRMM